MTDLAWEDEGAHGGLMHRRSNAACLTEHEVEEFLFNRLSGVTREVIEEHLLACHRCLDRVEKEQDYLEATRAAARVCEQESLERAYSGAPKPGVMREWISRLQSAFFWTDRRLFAVALASVMVVGAVVVWNPVSRSPQEPQQVSLHLHRGVLVAGEAHAGRPLSLSLDASDLPGGVYAMELLDENGAPFAKVEAESGTGKLAWNLQRGLPAGRYWIRLRRPGTPPVLIREYGLNVVR